ncbi:uncharacterized protein V6R79_014105 [Siganus canaliculatus]
MNVGTAHSEVNPNTRVMNSRGMWLSYILGIGLLHIILLSIPFASVPVVWTLTNLIHNLCMYLLLHTVKGTPFETPDQGKARLLTHWEQMDYGVQFTASRKFLTITPIVLYILTSFYTKYDRVHFVVNTVSLLTVLIPKLPQLHGVRIFGINKRDCRVSPWQTDTGAGRSPDRHTTPQSDETLMESESNDEVSSDELCTEHLVHKSSRASVFFVVDVNIVNVPAAADRSAAYDTHSTRRLTVILVMSRQRLQQWDGM